MGDGVNHAPQEVFTTIDTVGFVSPVSFLI